MRLAFTDVEALVERFGEHVSASGIFIRSRDPRPVGTRLPFELCLRGGEPVFAGTGVVRFVRRPGQPGLAGMGLEFETLSDESRRLVERIVGARAEGRLPPPLDGASPADWIDRPPSAPVAMPEALPVTVAPATTCALQLGWSSLRATLADGRALPIPATVAERAGELVFGGEAEALVGSGANGVRGLVRLAGAFAGAKSLVAFERRELVGVERAADGAAAVRLAGEARSGRELLAGLFRAVRSALDEGTGSASFAATIAMPSAATAAARRDVIAAAREAGFEAPRLVPAPLAFAPSSAKRWLVVQLDVGGMEAAVVESGRLVATASDPDLGGAELELSLVGAALVAFEEETGVAVPEDRALFERVRRAVADARDALETSLDVEVRVPGLVTTGLAKAELFQRLSRARLHAAWTPLVERAQALVREALAQRGLGLGEVERIVAGGDAGGLPAFVRLLSQRLGVDVELVTAAAVDERAPAGGVLGASLWMGRSPDGLRRLMERGAALPAQRTTSALQTDASQTHLALELRQGERQPPAENDVVGVAVAGPLPEGGRGLVQVTFVVTVDASGGLLVSAREAPGGGEVPVRLETRPASTG